MIPDTAYRFKDSVMANKYRYLAVVALLVLAVFLSAGPAKSSTIPTFAISSVNVDQDVTITPYNFPANQTFTVTMGPYGSLGVNGVVIGTVTTDASGNLSQTTYAIPDQLKGSYRIAIRLQTSHAYPYYAYNWFYNDTSGTGGPGVPPPSGYTGYPSFSISAVTRDANVTISPTNFPPNQTFTVTMGPMGTQGYNGFVADTVTTDANGALSKTTYAIPAQLAGSYRISIRLSTAHAYPYFAYNWFYNNSTNTATQLPSTGTGSQEPVPLPEPVPVYSGNPSFKVCAVAQGSSVTIAPTNFPPNQTFTVMMNHMWTSGANGYQVETVTTDANGNLSDTNYPIPAELAGNWQIAIRLQTGGTYPYFAYNWFYNNTATVC